VSIAVEETFLRSPLRFTANKDAKFINQMPGEYVVKVYNGEQVRETKFSIGNNGTYADNGIARQSNLTTNKVILPVKVMGTLEVEPGKCKRHGLLWKPSCWCAIEAAPTRVLSIVRRRPTKA
jgi:hypothetical protein